jgi:hypothetical protein
VGLIWFLVIAALGGWLYFSHLEDQAKVERLRRERAELEASRLQHPDALLRFAGCMANHASDVSQISTAGVIHTVRSGKQPDRDDYAQFEKIRDALVRECSPRFGAEVRSDYPNLTSTDLNNAFLRVMAQDPQVLEWLNTLNAASEGERKAYVK